MDSIAMNLPASALCVERFDVDGGASGLRNPLGVSLASWARRPRVTWCEQMKIHC